MGGDCSQTWKAASGALPGRSVGLHGGRGPWLARRGVYRAAVQGDVSAGLVSGGWNHFSGVSLEDWTELILTVGPGPDLAKEGLGLGRG